jgi:iron(III) transport system substrate-binding protein
VVAALCLAATSAVAGSPPVSPALQSVIDGARKEGKLDLVWGAASLGGSEGISKLAAAFNNRYGLNINVQFTPGPSDQEMAAKIIQEFQTQRPASSDVYHGSSSPILPLIQAQALLDGKWSTWALNARNPDSLAPGGVAVSVQTQLPGFTYNSSKLQGTHVPMALGDLLKPEYKGHIASTPYASGWDLVSVLWGEEKALDYINKFSGQLGGLIRCSEPQRLSSGEFDILAFDCNQVNAIAAKAKGQPLDFLIASDAAMAVDMYLAVPKNAAHPNAAKLWIDFVLSRAAQDIIYSHEFQDSDLIPGSNTAKLMSSIDTRGNAFIRANIAFYQKTGVTKLTAFGTQVGKIFQKK